MDEIHTDAMGNLIAVKKCGKPGAKKLMLDAHMDEIGLIVTDIGKNGFLRFGKLGGIDPRMLPAREIMVMTSRLFSELSTRCRRTLWKQLTLT